MEREHLQSLDMNYHTFESGTTYLGVERRLGSGRTVVLGKLTGVMLLTFSHALAWIASRFVGERLYENGTDQNRRGY